VRLFLSGSDGFFVAGMSAAGGAINDGVLELTGGEETHVRLVASGETGSVDGVVKDSAMPAPGVLVVLAPAGNSSDPHRFWPRRLTAMAATNFLTHPRVTIRS
jgi:hypothetical protein